MSTIAEELFRDEHEEGLKEGREEGRQEAQRLIAKALLSAGDSVEKVMTITGLTRAEVEALKAH
jgi:predicted transposase/invertase (TIGR01784 family)